MEDSTAAPQRADEQTTGSTPAKSNGGASLEAFRKTRTIAREAVNVPGWGGTIWVRGFSARERDRYEQSLLRGRPGPTQTFSLEGSKARMAAVCCVHADGRQFFEPGDEEKLQNEPAEILSRICKVAMRLSGMGEADEQQEDAAF